MSITNKISNLEGDYNSLSFPVLGVLEIRKDSNFLVNDTFKRTFLSDHKEEMHLEIIKNHILKLKDISQIHHKGNIYQVDEFDLVKGVKYYFYSLSSKSVHHSFLWLKHDLLNILNPIMGFADVLEESDEISEDDHPLVIKIKNNSDKLYQQIQKLSLLQNLDTNSNQNSGSYEISDFIFELKNQLVANNIFENISKTEVTHQGKVSDRITHSDFRSTLKEHLAYLSEYQKQKDIKIISTFSNHAFKVIIQLAECNPPSSYIDMIEEIDKFILECKPIKKLQINALNYLILNEICDSIGASVLQKKEKNNIILELNLPSLSKESEVTSIKLNEVNPHKSILQNDLFKEMPDELYKDVKSLWLGFDGLLILDEWQKMCEKFTVLNKKYQDKVLDNIIHEMKNGIQAFDIEKLRNIQTQCQHEFID